jgi:transposase InsO family protein
MFMKQHQERYDVSKMAGLLGVSRSGYYAFKKRKPSKRDEEERELTDMIKHIFEDHYGRYGSPRVWEELKALGWRVSRKRVERIMREQHLFARKRRKHINTTDSCHHFAFAGNILNQNFHADFPGEKWVSDITYLRTDSGWLYLTVILDLWDRKVIGWSMAKEPTANHVCSALEMAVVNRNPKEGLIFHSDRGVQYCSDEFKETLARLCPLSRQSMSRKGNCWDNACAESFFKTLKVEMDISKRRYNVKQTKAIIFEYIEVYYNRRRRHSTLGYAIPIAFANNVA